VRTSTNRQVMTRFSISRLLTRSPQVCNDIRHMSDFSSELIRLTSSISTGFRSLHLVQIVPSLRKSLRQSKPAWQRPNTPNEIRAEIPPGTYQWSYGTLVFPGEALQQRTVFQPQLADSGHSNSTSLRQWGCQTDSAVSLQYFTPAGPPD
jgi:hypothetical protein